MNKNKGFTLIEILIVVDIIAVLATVVLVAVNPSRQFKLARDTQRTSNVNAILNAVTQNIAEHKGLFTCNGTSTPISSTATVVKSNSGGLDIAKCVVPDYISSLPFDPSVTGAHYTSTSDYDTGYTLYKDSDGRITVSATGEITTFISVTR